MDARHQRKQIHIPKFRTVRSAARYITKHRAALKKSLLYERDTIYRTPTLLRGVFIGTHEDEKNIYNVLRITGSENNALYEKVCNDGTVLTCRGFIIDEAMKAIQRDCCGERTTIQEHIAKNGVVLVCTTFNFGRLNRWLTYVNALESIYRWELTRMVRLTGESFLIIGDKRWAAVWPLMSFYLGILKSPLEREAALSLITRDWTSRWTHTRFMEKVEGSILFARNIAVHLMMKHVHKMAFEMDTLYQTNNVGMHNIGYNELIEHFDRSSKFLPVMWHHAEMLRKLYKADHEKYTKTQRGEAC